VVATTSSLFCTPEITATVNVNSSLGPWYGDRDLRIRIAEWLAWPLVVLVKLYQWIISPLFPSSCRFYPTCSSYSIQSLRKHGLFKGFWLAVRRIVRCHPGNPGGYDPVP